MTEEKTPKPQKVGQDLIIQATAANMSGREVWRSKRKGWWSYTKEAGLWAPDERLQAEKIAADMVYAFDAGASWGYVEAVLRGAKRLVAAVDADFDLDPWILGVKNGSVDLRSGKHSGPDPWLMLTKAAPTAWDPSASCPKWLQHLGRLFQDCHPDSIELFQRAVGAALVGDSNQKDQVYVVIEGASGSGKGTAFRLLQAVFGDLVTTLDAAHLSSKRYNSHSSWNANLDGARIVTVEEVRKSSLDVSRLKLLTGGDRLRSQAGIGQDFYTWSPTHTLFLASNHALDFGGDSTGMRRRYYPLITGPSLTSEELSGKTDWEISIREEELPGILNWAVEGCLKWREDGGQLQRPSWLVETRDRAMEASDPLTEFVEDKIVPEPGYFTTRGKISDAWSSWSLENDGGNGYRSVNAVKLVYGRLRELGYEPVAIHGGKRGFKGFKIKDQI